MVGVKGIIVEPLRVVLCGHSVLLDTLAVGLRHLQVVEVIPLAAPLPETETLAALRPDVVLFDIGAAFPQPLFNLLVHCPTLRLIGLDADCNRAVVWSAKQLNELSFSYLTALLANGHDEATRSAAEPIKEHTS